MPVYDYACHGCGEAGEMIVSVGQRDNQVCRVCGTPLTRRQGAPLFRFAGRITKGGGPDRFTADALGIPLKELPPGLRS